MKKARKEKKLLVKKFKALIEDLLDNYEQYTDEEKAQIKEIFEKTARLNTVLDKYDVEKESVWAEYCSAVSNYFNNFNMGC